MACAGSALFIGDTYRADYLGPREQGISALLIDPKGSAAIPEHDRLTSLFDLQTVLGSTTPGSYR